MSIGEELQCLRLDNLKRELDLDDLLGVADRRIREKNLANWATDLG